MKRLITLKSTEVSRTGSAEPSPVSNPVVSSRRAEKLVPLPANKERLQLNLKPLKANQRRKEMEGMVEALHKDHFEISKRRRDNRMSSSIRSAEDFYNDSFSSRVIGDVSEIDISVLSIPHSRKNPNSLYNSSRNTSCSDNHLKRQEILARIDRVEGLLESMPKRHEIKQSLTTAFEICIETEAKSYFPVWVKVLDVIETVVYEFTAKARRTVSSISAPETARHFEEVNQLLNKDLEIDDPREETMLTIAKDLSILWRSIIKTVTDTEVQGVLEVIWNGVIKLLNKSITSQSIRITKALEAVQEQSKTEKLQLQKMFEGMVKLWEGKIVGFT